MLRLGAQGYVAVYTPADTCSYSQLTRAVQLEVRPGGLWLKLMHSLLWVGVGLLCALALSALVLAQVRVKKRRSRS